MSKKQQQQQQTDKNQKFRHLLSVRRTLELTLAELIQLRQEELVEEVASNLRN